MGEVIDKRLEIWSEASQSNHPALFRGGIAAHIVKQCTLQPEDIAHLDDEAFPAVRADSLQTYKEQARRRDQLEHEALLSVTLDDTLDALDIQDEDFHRFFQRVFALQNNPHVPDTYRTAARCLYRIFAQREHIATLRSQGEFERTNFVLVLDRLIHDLF